MSMYVKVEKIPGTDRLQFYVIQSHETKHHEPKEIVTIPDMSQEQWEKDIQECPKSFCVHFNVMATSEGSILIQTESKAPVEAMVKQIQVWFDKKYPTPQ